MSLPIKADLEWDIWGQLQDARNIHVGPIIFDNLMELYEALTPHSKETYQYIEDRLAVMARNEWEDHRRETQELKEWEARR